MSITRRNFLRLGAAAAATAALPAPTIAAPAEVLVDLAKGPDLLAFIVGTPGEFDWHVVFARTAQEAYAQRFGDIEGASDEGGSDDAPPVEFDEECVSRVPRWDHRDPQTITNVDWVKAGFGTYCSRCGDEQLESHIIGDEVVCEYCMRDVDWIVALDREEAIEHIANRLGEGRQLAADALALARERGLLAEAEALLQEWSAS